MTYDLFKEQILDALTDILPGDTSCKITSVLKNNSLTLDSVVITELGVNVSPTIYLGYYYNLYCDGNKIDDIAAQIVEVYDENKSISGLDMSFFIDFENVKDKIAYKVINKKQNEMLLQDVPYISFLDLAIVFFYDATELSIINSTSEFASILIKNDHLLQWGITVEELKEVANINTPNLFKPDLKTMQSFINSGSVMCNNQGTEVPDIYILSNDRGVHGAGCILYKGLLKSIADEFESDLIVLPSSIHELLLLPMQDIADTELDFDRLDDMDEAYKSHLIRFNDMVSEVNSTAVDREEVLSEHAYYYDRVCNEVRY